MGDETTEPADVEAAEETLEHVKALWEDQVALAETLVEKRKTHASILAIVVGLGVFRIQFVKNVNETWAIAASPLLTLKILLTLALCAFAVGAYLLHTQRSNVRSLCWWCGTWLWSLCRFLYAKARASDAEAADQVTLSLPKRHKWPGRALSTTLPEQERLDDWVSQPRYKLVVLRTNRLRDAYLLLKEANQRISDRLRDALLLLFSGYFLVFVALGVYLWSIGSAP